MTRHASTPMPADTMQSIAEPHGSELPPVVAEFLERLRKLPLGAWADAGRRLEEIDSRDRRGSGAAAGASGEAIRAQLRQVVDEMPRVAGHVRLRVLDLAAVAQGIVRPAEAALMKKAALAAALALVARPALGDARFHEIYEPFATLSPLSSLCSSPESDAGAPAPPAPDS